jgi:hypothetical protein
MTGGAPSHSSVGRHCFRFLHGNATGRVVYSSEPWHPTEENSHRFALHLLACYWQVLHAVHNACCW